MKMNKFFVKLLVSILIVLTLVNFIGSIDVYPNYSFADAEEGEARVSAQLEGNNSNLGISIINAILFFIPVMYCRAIRSVISIIASAGGTTGGAGMLEISPFDIFFNRCTLLDANIFSTTDRDGNPLDTDSMVYKIRSNAAVWYYAIRTLAIGVIAIMLLWNLVRSISKNTSAEQKSVAKNSLTDWVLSFALIMFMHIIVIVVLNFNDLLLQGIQNFTPYSDSSDFYDALENSIFSTNIVLGITGLTVYVLLMFQTMKYILIYIQRLLTIVLLIMISPIVPITYSTDRMRGGKGAALNGWLKELIFNVFVQSIHAIVYAALVGVAMASISSTTSITGITDLGNAFVAIAAMLFIKYAERMVKTIFGFDASQVLNKNVFADAATTVVTAANNVSSIAQRTAMGGASMVSFGQNVGGAPGLGGGISFGQNVGGLGAGAGAGMGLGGGSPLAGLQGGIRQSGNALMNGLGSIGDSMAGDGTLLGGIANIATGEMSPAEGHNLLSLGSGEDRESGSAYAEASAEAEATASAEATATAQNGENGEDGVAGADGADAGGFIPDGGEDLEHEKKQDDKQRQMSANLNMVDEKSDERLTEQEKKMNALESAVKSTQESKEDKTSTIENKVEKEHIEEVADVTEENHLEEDTQIVGPEPVGGGMDPETLDKIKEKFGNELQPGLVDKLTQMLDNNIKPELLEAVKAITEENKEKLDEIKDGLNEQLNTLKGDIGEDKADEIENKVDKIWNNPEELKKYINSLPEGSKEREYAENYARLSAMMAIDNKNMSDGEKLETIVETGEALGDTKQRNETTAPNVPNTANTTNDGTVSAGISTSGGARTMQAVNEAATKETEVEQVVDNEVVDPSAFDAIDDDNLRSTMEDLATIYPEKYIVKGRLEGKTKTQIENELDAQIVEDFSSTMQEFTEKMGREPKGIQDIYRNMEEKARKQFAEYKTGKLSARDLDGDARALAALEVQARRMNYRMEAENVPNVQQTATNVEYSIGQNGPVRTTTTNDLNTIIVDLQAERQKREERSKQKLA